MQRGGERMKKLSGKFGRTQNLKSGLFHDISLKKRVQVALSRNSSFSVLSPSPASRASGDLPAFHFFPCLHPPPTFVYRFSILRVPYFSTVYRQYDKLVSLSTYLYFIFTGGASAHIMKHE